MDNPYELDSTDIALIKEALDSWVSSGTTGLLLSAMLSSIGPDRSEETRDAEMKAAVDKNQREKDQKTDRATLLRAKLIHMQDRNTAESISEGFSR